MEAQEAEADEGHEECKGGGEGREKTLVKRGEYILQTARHRLTPKTHAHNPTPFHPFPHHWVHVHINHPTNTASSATDVDEPVAILEGFNQAQSPFVFRELERGRTYYFKARVFTYMCIRLTIPKPMDH